MMTYRLTPKAEHFYLTDCAEGDHPRRKPRKLPPEQAALARKYRLEPQMEGDAAIAVIGGADGPTAVFCTVRGSAEKKWREPLRQPPPAILPRCGRKRSYGRRNFLTENPAGIPQFHCFVTFESEKMKKKSLLRLEKIDRTAEMR